MEILEYQFPVYLYFYILIKYMVLKVDKVWLNMSTNIWLWCLLHYNILEKRMTRVFLLNNHDSWKLASLEENTTLLYNITNLLYYKNWTILKLQMKIATCCNVTHNTKTGTGKLKPGGNEIPVSIMCPNQLKTRRKPDLTRRNKEINKSINKKNN